MRGLAEGAKGHEKIGKLMAEKFVFLNVYCRSVKEEHEPRGPEGPYQFNDRSVPVAVLKKWDGSTVVQQLGFAADPKQNLRTVAGWLEKGLKENGPVLPPKKLRPLVKLMTKAERYLEKKRPGNAWKELKKLVKLGDDKKKFPGPPPTVVTKAKAMRSKIEADLDAAIAKALAKSEPKAAKKALSALHRSYGSARPLKAKINAATKSL